MSQPTHAPKPSQLNRIRERKNTKQGRKPQIRSLMDARGKIKPPAGRPDMRNDVTVVSMLEESIREGNTFDNACLLSRVSIRSFFKWMKEGKEAEEGTLAREFWHRMEAAKAQAEADSVKTIRSGSKGWQAHAWFLERRNNKEWGRKDNISIEGKGDKPLLMNGEKVITESGALAALKAILDRDTKLIEG